MSTCDVEASLFAQHQEGRKHPPLQDYYFLAVLFLAGAFFLVALVVLAVFTGVATGVDVATGVASTTGAAGCPMSLLCAAPLAPLTRSLAN